MVEVKFANFQTFSIIFNLLSCISHWKNKVVLNEYVAKEETLSFMKTNFN